VGSQREERLVELSPDREWRRADYVEPELQPAAPVDPEDLILRITEFASRTNHEFWPDDVSLQVFDQTRLHSSRLLTDVYLLALSAAHGGRLVTFDEGIPLAAVRSAAAEHLVVL